MPHLQIAIVLIWRDHRVLVQRRLATAEHLPNVWEELGVEIEIIGERETFKFEYSNRTVTLHPFDATIISGKAQPLASSELCWMFPCEMNLDEFPAANAILIGQLW